MESIEAGSSPGRKGRGMNASERCKHMIRWPHECRECEEELFQQKGRSKPPYRCIKDNEQLCRVEVYDTKAKKEMGHLWKCPRCNLCHIGFGNPGEYVSEPLKPRPAPGGGES